MDAMVELLALPQPLHFFEFLTGSGHYHQGCFREGDSLAAALERTARLATDGLAPASRVLDVGCGLGGTTALLERLGFDVTGIDPCLPGVRYARERHPTIAARLVHGSLEEHVDGRWGASWDGLLVIEALQHFPDLDGLLAGCRGLLVDGGRIVLVDHAVRARLPWTSAPVHACGAVAAAAARCGLRVTAHADLTEQALPTLPVFLGRLAEERADLLTAFAGRPRVAEELDQLCLNMRWVQRALEQGELAFELTVLEKP